MLIIVSVIENSAELINLLKDDERVFDARKSDESDSIIVILTKEKNVKQFSSDYEEFLSLVSLEEVRKFHKYQDFEDFCDGSWLDLYGFGHAPAVEQQALVEELEDWFDVPGNFAILKNGQWKFFEEYEFEVGGLPVQQFSVKFNAIS